MKITSLLLTFFIGCTSWAQLTSSSLPIVKINTSGQTIPDDPKILATMEIIDNGPGSTNNINDLATGYNGNIGIETRGNSTQDYEKKTYSIELRTSANADTSVSILGMPKEEDWILHAMVIDKSLLRIPFSFYLSQRMGHYASRWKFCEVVINGDYRGLYLMTEKIKRDQNRVDIAKLNTIDISGDEVTGGYILRIDWLDNPQGFATNYNSMGGNPMFYQWLYPKPANVQPEQTQYIQNFMNEFEEAVFSSNYTNQNGFRYNYLINTTSFVDFLLINEFSKNSDGYKLSTYMHKDKDSKGGKLNAGPIWDFDQTYGMSEVCSCSDYTGWTYLQNQPACEDFEAMPTWWQNMMADTLFTNHLDCRWTDFRNTFMHNDSINDWIDSWVTNIQPAVDRNFQRWPDFIGEQIWNQPEPVPQSYAEEISVWKAWMAQRLNWLDTNLPGTCANDVVGVKEPEIVKNERLNIYPNPSTGVIHFTSEIGSEVTITDLGGKIVKQFKVTNPRITIDLSEHDSGIYTILIVNRDNITTNQFILE